jgi:hypothetical protein
VYCHGVGGVNGNVKQAANLQSPKSGKFIKFWVVMQLSQKIKRGLSCKKMKQATTHLILNGAIAHNSSFKQPWYDPSKAAPYNGQMLGVMVAQARAWLKKYKKKYGLLPEVAVTLFIYTPALGKKLLISLCPVF